MLSKADQDSILASQPTNVKSYFLQGSPGKVSQLSRASVSRTRLTLRKYPKTTKDRREVYEESRIDQSWSHIPKGSTWNQGSGLSKRLESYIR